MTYPKFEEIWQSKFQNAQENPSEAIWEAIAWQIGHKERQRKKWIAWWAAALIAFFLGDGRFVYKFYGEFFKGIWQKETTAVLVTKDNNGVQKNTEKAEANVSKKIKKEIFQTSVSQQNHQEEAHFFAAEAAYELAAEKVASKKSSEETVKEVLGKPKKRAFWLKTYTQVQHIQPNFSYSPQLPLASRMMLNLQSAQKEQNLQKELSSFRHLFTWGLGVEMGWQFHKNFYLLSGLQFQRSTFSFESGSSRPELAHFWGKIPESEPIANREPAPMMIETETDVISMASPATIAPTATYQFRQRMDLITIPLKLGYQQVGNRWQYGVAAGVENSFLLSNTFQSKEENFGEVAQKANRLQIVALAEISVAFRINHKISLHISPSFRQFLTSPIAHNPNLKINNQSFGIGTGVQIGL
ncbi:MAG: hypothetical protein OHK0045_24450 [Raineya sp.]